MSSPTRIAALEGPLNKLIARRMRVLGFERLEQFAHFAGIGEATLYSLVLGRRTLSGERTRPRLDTLVSLSHALEMPLGELVYLVAPDGLAPEAGHEFSEDSMGLLRYPVQLAGWVGAGPSQDDSEEGERPVYVEAAFAAGKDLRAFRVRGDSMAAGKRPIQDGDLIIVNALDQGYNTASVVARLTDDTYVVKMLKDDKFGRLLQSRNPEHTNGTPSAIPMEHVAEIVGRVVRVIADDDA